MAGLIYAPYDPSWPQDWELNRLIDRLVIPSGWQTVRRYSYDWHDLAFLLGVLERRFHGLIKTPFVPGEMYWCGWTPHGMTGWNDRPDYYASGPTLPLAVCYAALLTTAEGAALLGCPWAVEPMEVEAE